MHSIDINKNIEKKRKSRSLKNKKRREVKRGKERKLNSTFRLTVVQYYLEIKICKYYF